VYWVRALQHFGYYRLHPESPGRFKLLYPLLDLTTTLDPNFNVAYRFGAVFLAEPDPGGAGRPDLAVRLLEKGVKTRPNRWEYYHDIGFVYYWHLHDFQKAAEWFQRGGALPGSPWWLRTYAAVMLTRGGDRQASRLMWQNMLQTSESGWLRENAEHRLSQLDALDQIDQLRRAVDEYQRRRGTLPETWSDLIAARLMPGMPVDPSGAAYVLDPDTGQITLGPESKLRPLPTEPAPGEQ
jgi:tetratricopeptide (TPR) repeat protein